MSLLPEKLNCWHNCDRRQAGQLLLSGACKPGTYLLRPCHSRAEKYALSVLQENHSLLPFGRRRLQPKIRNYLIKEKPNDGGYYIFSSQCFQEVQQLIQYYSTPRRRMHTTLRFPFPRMAIDTGGGDASASALRADKDKKLQLLQKICEGSYQMYTAELNGARVVSLVLDGGNDISALVRASAPFASHTDEAANELPPLPPRQPTITKEAKLTPLQLDEQAKRRGALCTLKAAHGHGDGEWSKPLLADCGSSNSRRWSAVARSQVDRCSRIAERMLQKFLN